jgi:hypothetical protein
MRLVRDFTFASLILGISSCTHTTTARHEARPIVVSTIDDARVGLGIGKIHYGGHWERVKRRYDGRDEGTSSRSFHVGDNFAVVFDGYRLRVYGVVGPNGGHGIIGIDDLATMATLEFFAPVKRTHVLLYTSPMLNDGFHVAAVIVDPGRNRRSRGSYVNVDSVAIEGRSRPPLPTARESP